MIGRQTIQVNRPITDDEILYIMQQKWDTLQYNSFAKGKPTPASIDEFIMLPATARYMVIVYAAKKNVFNKEDKVVLSVCQTAEGFKDGLLAALPTHNMIIGAYQISKTMSSKKERKGPAEDVLQIYTEYMRKILTECGLC